MGFSAIVVGFRLFLFLFLPVQFPLGEQLLAPDILSRNRFLVLWAGETEVAHLAAIRPFA